MKLVASNDTVGNATIPIRWCLTPEEIAHLRQNKVADPHLLLVIVHEKKNVDRQLVPLDRMMTYLSFNHPGENTVFATIVWHAGGKKELKKWCLNTNKYGNWETEFYDSKEDTLKAGDYALARIAVKVSPEFFAKDPPAWLKWWVNLWYETGFRNQCQFKKRLLFVAVPIQPWFVLLWVIIITLFRFLAATYWFVFRTKTEVNFKAIIRPFKYESEDVWHKTRYSRNFYEQDKNGKNRSGVVWLFHPATILLVAALLFGVDALWVHFFSAWWPYLLLSPVVIGVLLVVLSAVMLVVTLVSSLAVRLFKGLKLRQVDEVRRVAEEIRKKKEKEARKLEEQRLAMETKMRSLEHDLALLTCDGSFVAKIEALPREKQTVHLRFLDLKSKRCKPFAG